MFTIILASILVFLILILILLLYRKINCPIAVLYSLLFFISFGVLFISVNPIISFQNCVAYWGLLPFVSIEVFALKFGPANNPDRKRHARNLLLGMVFLILTLLNVFRFERMFM